MNSLQGTRWAYRLLLLLLGVSLGLGCRSGQRAQARPMAAASEPPRAEAPPREAPRPAPPPTSSMPPSPAESSPPAAGRPVTSAPPPAAEPARAGRPATRGTAVARRPSSTAAPAVNTPVEAAAPAEAPAPPPAPVEAQVVYSHDSSLAVGQVGHFAAYLQQAARDAALGARFLGRAAQGSSAARRDSVAVEVLDVVRMDVIDPTGDSWTITPAPGMAQEQALARAGERINRWEWLITPKKAGSLTLVVSFSTRTAEGNSEWLSERKTITVVSNESALDRFFALLSSAPGWLFTAVVIPLALLGWRGVVAWLRRRRSGEGADVS